MIKVFLGSVLAALVTAKPSVRALDAEFDNIMKRVNYPHSAIDSRLARQTLLEINSFHFNADRPRQQIHKDPVKVQQQVFLPDLSPVSDDEVETFIETAAQAKAEKVTPIRAPTMYNHPAPPKARQPLPPQMNYQAPQAPTMPQFAQYGQYQQPQPQQYQQMQFVQQPQMQYAPQPQPVQFQPQYVQQPQPMYQQMAYQQAPQMMPMQPAQGMYPGQMDASGAMRFRQEQHYPEFQSQVSVLPNVNNGAPAYGFATNGGFQPIQRQITAQDMQFSQKVRANNHAEPVVPDLPPPPVVSV